MSHCGEKPEEIGENKEFVEAVRKLLRYAISGSIAEKVDKNELPTLSAVNEATSEVLKLAEIVGLLEEDND